MSLTTKETISRMNAVAGRIYPGFHIIPENDSDGVIMVVRFVLYGKVLFVLDVRGYTSERIMYEITDVMSTLRRQGKL